MVSFKSITGRTSSKFESPHDEDKLAQRGWQPFCLQKLPLAGFAALLLALVAALQVMDSYAESHQGLATANQSFHYLWTYGPTADYVSPILPVAFYQACRNRHFQVVSTSLGSVILKLLIVASSGLLALKTVDVTNIPTSLMASTTFDGTGYNSSIVNPHPTWVVYGLAQELLSSTQDMMDGYLMQSFNATSSIPTGAVLSGEVDAFTSELNCEPASMTKLKDHDPADTRFGYECQNIRIASDSCVIDISCLGDDYSASADARLINCENRTDIPPTDLLLWSTYRKIGTKDDFEVGGPLVEFSGLICKPVYSISRAIQSINYIPTTNPGAGAASVSLSPTAQTREIQGVSAMDLLRGILNDVENSTGGGGFTSVLPMKGEWQVLAKSDYLRIHNFIGLTALHNNVTVLALSEDHELFHSSVKRTYNTLAREVAKYQLMSTTADEFQGSYSYKADRLFTQELSLRLMQSGLGVVALLTIYLLFAQPSKAVVSCSPASVGALAAILSRSHGVTESLVGTGHISSRNLEHLLAEDHYKTVVQSDGLYPVFAIEKVAGRSDIYIDKRAPNPAEEGSKSWWQPMPFLVWFLALLVLGPAILIAVLEITYRVALSKDGFGNVDVGQNEFVGYVWTYLPTLLLVTLATMFDSLNFQAQASQPYRALHEGASVEKALLSNLLKRISILDLWDAIKFREVALFFAAISVMIAPFLTIIASGLFVPERVDTVNSITVNRIDKWRDEPDFDPHFENLRLTTNMVLSGNLTYPNWTYEDLVLAKVEMPKWEATDVDALDFRNATSLNVQIPALRMQPNCSVVPPYMYRTEFDGDEYYVRSDGLYGCSYELEMWGGTYRNDSEIGLVDDRQYSVGKHGQCPRILSYFGNVSGHPPRVSSGSLVGCFAYLETVDVNVTFTVENAGPNASLVIDTTHPPEPIEPTAEILTLDGNDIVGFLSMLMDLGKSEGGLDNFFQHLVNGVHGVPVEKLNDQKILVDAVSDLIAICLAQNMHEKRRLPYPANATLADAATDDGNGQSPNTDKPNNGPPPRVLNATITNPSRTRLKQNELSTRLLQGALGAIIICAIGVIATLNRKRILPKNPQSIAGTASLLAGSRLLHGVPAGAEWWGRREMGERGVFGAAEYKLGWWEGGEKVGEGKDGFSSGSRSGSGSESGNESSDEERSGGEGGVLTGARFGIDMVSKELD
ncbi:hypothetical protein FQN54_009152 [Arachnomyces sp. PD_36]|nr:hypothetical protein FQN54_009152 [Arachnomyces sp. PD_36]